MQTFELRVGMGYRTLFKNLKNSALCGRSKHKINKFGGKELTKWRSKNHLILFPYELNYFP